MSRDPHSTSPRTGTRQVVATRVSGPNRPPEKEVTSVVVEDALTVDVEGVGKYTLMWTPTEAIADSFGFTDDDGVLADEGNPEALCLAAGFALGEGLICELADIASMAVCLDEPEVVKLVLKNPQQATPMRSDVLIGSSCGICGSRDIVDNNIYGLEQVEGDMVLSEAGFGRLMEDMRAGQQVFGDTGGSHAAAIFAADGSIASVAEDLGRHNALDKAIGRHLLEGRSFENCGALLSSRLSLEMVLKVIRARLQIVAAVSAPTSLAIELAERFGVTLCGFVREERMTVYTHPWRIPATGVLRDQ